MNQNKTPQESFKLHNLPKIITIGVYGYDEDKFFQTLQETGVDTFCDIRARRGVRGARYAFANSKRLQGRLDDLGIQYQHFPKLAPTKEIREYQKEADNAAKVAKRKRTGLDESFVNAYQEEILSSFNLENFLQELGGQSQVIALFCVEREPAACHRSLITEKLEQEFALKVEHKTP